MSEFVLIERNQDLRDYVRFLNQKRLFGTSETEAQSGLASFEPITEWPVLGAWGLEPDTFSS